MTVAVIGSRSLPVDLTPYIPPDASRILSVGSRGIGQVAKRCAKALGLPFILFPPDYSRYGRCAPFMRDRAMVDAADLVMAVWDGASPDTRYILDYAKKQGKPVKIYLV